MNDEETQLAKLHMMLIQWCDMYNLDYKQFINLIILEMGIILLNPDIPLEDRKKILAVVTKQVTE